MPCPPLPQRPSFCRCAIWLIFLPLHEAEILWFLPAPRVSFSMSIFTQIAVFMVVRSAFNVKLSALSFQSILIDWLIDWVQAGSWYVMWYVIVCSFLRVGTRMVSFHPCVFFFFFFILFGLYCYWFGSICALVCGFLIYDSVRHGSRSSIQWNVRSGFVCTFANCSMCHVVSAGARQGWLISSLPWERENEGESPVYPVCFSLTFVFFSSLPTYRDLPTHREVKRCGVWRTLLLLLPLTLCLLVFY